MKILCTICVRGGSKGLKNKALLKINKLPLIAYTIEVAKKIKQFDQIVVSTDSKKIQNTSKNMELNPGLKDPLNYLRINPQRYLLSNMHF